MVEEVTTRIDDGMSAPVRLEEPLLILVAGESDQLVIELARGQWTIGKDEAADIRIDGSGVSRRHVVLARALDDVVTVTDQQSTNGTYVNGVRITAPTVLSDGDELGLGRNVVFEFRRREASSSPQSDPPIDPRSSKLSARELEVAAHVARGMTNPEIGRTLHISPRTVARHLENMYRKLGIGTRAALATFVTQSGLGRTSTGER